MIRPWQVWLASGDRRLLEESWPMMKGWVEFIRSQARDGVLWNTGFHFGDWVALDAKEGSLFGATPNDLTATARNELPLVSKNIIHDREADFVTMFNKAGPISIRLHQLELLPGIGKKHLQEMLDARQQKPFDSFKDIQHRVPLLPDPGNLIQTRVTEELQGVSKYYLFVRPPARHHEEYGYSR